MCHDPASAFPGFNDAEIVALLGAHALGRCHPDRSGFDGPWTRAETTFSNEFFRLLVRVSTCVMWFLLDLYPSFTDPQSNHCIDLDVDSSV